MQNNKNLTARAEANIAKGIQTIIVHVVSAIGSTPRDKNAVMLIDANSTYDTIGGGQLEWIVVQKARSLLGTDFSNFTLTIPLGPEINQCCGGKMKLEFSSLNEATLKQMLDCTLKTEPNKPNIYIFGAGHTGTELAFGFSRLPVNTYCVDTRQNALNALENICQTICTPLPEDVIKAAPKNSAFIILTHDHNLDFMLTALALSRNDAAYVGMIGSATKKSVLKKWITQNDYDLAHFSNLTCPIGKSEIKDKRPNIIAALTIAEVLKSIFN